MTDAEKIRNMTDEELADFLQKIQDSERKDWTPIGCYVVLITKHIIS